MKHHTREEFLVKQLIHAHDSNNYGYLSSLRREARKMVEDDPQCKNKMYKMAIKEISSKMDMICDLHEDPNNNPVRLAN